MSTKKPVKYMPAVSQDEAEEMVKEGYGWDSKQDARHALAEIKRIADFYARQYRVYEVISE